MVQFTFLEGLGLAVACILCCLCQPSASYECQPRNGLRLCGRKNYTDKETRRETFCTCDDVQHGCRVESFLTVIDNRNHSEDLENQPTQTLYFCEDFSSVNKCSFNEPPVAATHVSNAYKPRLWEILCLCSWHVVMELDNSELQFRCHDYKTCQKQNGLRLCRLRQFWEQANYEIHETRFCTCTEGKDDCPVDNAPNITVIEPIPNVDPVHVFVLCEPIQQEVCSKNQLAAVMTWPDRKERQWNISCLCNVNEHLVMVPPSMMRDGYTHNYICRMLCLPQSNNLRVCGYKYYADRHNAKETHEEKYCSCTRGYDDCMGHNSANKEITIINLRGDHGNRPKQVLFFCEDLSQPECTDNQIAATYSNEENKSFPWEIHCLCKKNNNGQHVMRLEDPRELTGPVEGNGTHHFTCLVDMLVYV